VSVGRPIQFRSDVTFYPAVVFLVAAISEDGNPIVTLLATIVAGGLAVCWCTAMFVVFSQAKQQATQTQQPADVDARRLLTIAFRSLL